MSGQILSGNKNIEKCFLGEDKVAAAYYGDSLVYQGFTVEDKVPYNFRKSGGSAEIGNKEIDKVVGGTIAWNQLARNETAPSSRHGLTITGSTDSFTVNGTAEQNSFATGWFKLVNDAVIPLANHVLFYFYGLKSGSVSNVAGTTFAPIAASPSFRISIGQATIKKIPSTLSIASGKSEWGYVQNTVFTDAVLYVQTIDLTQMFGMEIADHIYSIERTTAGAGVAFFKSLFPKDYYEYNAGELMSVQTNAHKMVGFNACGSELSFGNIDNTGADSGDSHTYIRTSDYSKVVPNSKYCFYANTVQQFMQLYVIQYDYEKKFISRTPIIPGSTLRNSGFGTRTLSKNTHYVRMFIYKNVVFDSLSDVEFCINLSLDEAKDGTYEPYELHSYALDPIELRGIPKLDSSNNLYYDGDTYESDGKVTRKYGIVDLGTLNWVPYALGNNCFYAMLSDAKATGTNNSTNCVCSQYAMANVVTILRDTDKTIGVGYLNISAVTGSVAVHDSAYADAASFKEAMSGVMLVYELATPTVETATPYTNPQVVNRYGTEEYSDYGVEQGTRNVSIPVGHDTQYLSKIFS